MEVEVIQMPEVVDAAYLNIRKAQLQNDWADQYRKTMPPEVFDFINELAEKLGDFGQIRKFDTMIPGSQLLLCGMKEIKGERIHRDVLYPTPVPHMIAVDHRMAMSRIYQRKGKAGLIAWVKFKVASTELAQWMNILTEHVFHEESPAFQKILSEIRASKKIESGVEL